MSHMHVQTMKRDVQQKLLMRDIEEDAREDDAVPFYTRNDRTSIATDSIDAELEDLNRITPDDPLAEDLELLYLHSNPDYKKKLRRPGRYYGYRDGPTVRLH
jgi:hypothetical protein